MRQIRRGRIFSALLVVACGHETFDLLPNDTVPLDSDGGAESTGGRDLPGAAGVGTAGVSDASGAGGSSDGFGGEPETGHGGEPRVPPPSLGGSPEQPGSGGSPDWVPPMAGAPGDGHCEKEPSNQCTPFTAVCMRCNPDKGEPNPDCSDTRVPYCDRYLGHCVQCIPPSMSDPGRNDCLAGEQCIAGTCRPLCSPTVACPAELRFCNQSNSICGECVFHEDCLGGPIRNNFCAMGKCVECFGSRDCPYYDTPVCDDFRCRACENDCECEDFEQCNRETGTCVPR
jgi:hypothetical protein